MEGKKGERKGGIERKGEIKRGREEGREGLARYRCG